jgi:Tol biopolymer transport system component
MMTVMAWPARCRACLWAAPLAAAAIAAAAPPAWAAPGDTVLASRATGSHGVKARGAFYSLPTVSQLSPGGRYVTFASDAGNLDPDDPDSTLDVYLRDLSEDTTTLVSRADGPLGVKGNGVSAVGDALAGGRYVVFNSVASNLDPADPDTTRDIYIRDVLTGETTLVSRADGAEGPKGNGESARGRLSSDGRVLAFHSTASNLDPADAEPDVDVFVRDLAANQTTLVTAQVTNAQLAALSDDGSHVAYLIPASTVFTDSGEPYGDLYVQDLRSGSRTLVAPLSLGSGVSLSANGRYVAFSSVATNLVPADHDRLPDVYVVDVQAGTTTLVSRDDGRNGRKGDNESLYGGSLSADGRLVAFTTSARNLDPLDGPYDTGPDVYVRDLRRHTTTLQSRSQSGAKGDKSSLLPALSADGRHMSFATAAHNFDPTDRDYRNDIYRRNLRAPLPSPGDPPRSSIGALRRTGTDGGLSVKGRATDDGEVQVVLVSLTRRLGNGRCERWNALWLRTPRRHGRCRPRFDLAAHFTRRWWRRFDAELRPGTYELLSRAVDTAGQFERRFKTGGNRRVFRIR